MKKSIINQDVQWLKNQIVKVPRTTFYIKKDWQCTCNAGDLIPMGKPIDVLPGDTHSIEISSLIRTSSSLVKPITGLIECHVAGYYIPFRIEWTKFDKFITGYQDDPDWTIDTNLILPHHTFATSGDSITHTIAKGSLGDYMELPVGVIGPDLKSADQDDQWWISSMYARGYADVWNNWYKDEATQKSISIPKDSENIEPLFAIGTSNDDEETPWNIDWYQGTHADIYLSNNGPLCYGKLCPINKKKDLFTSSLPSPQKGAPVLLSLGGEAPVFVRKNLDDGARYRPQMITYDSGGNVYGSMFIRDTLNSDPVTNTYNGFRGDDNGVVWAQGGGAFHTDFPVGEWNYYANLRGLSQINVNDLRLGIQTQLVKEADARYGTRPKEYYGSHFGVLTADSRLQIPEYLGSFHFFLNVNQVVQNSSSTETSPQGNLSAYSQTNTKNYLFTKSFTEFGFILIVFGIRQATRTYSQGIAKSWKKFTRFSHYLPEFAHIGEQPVLNSEIFMQSYDESGTNEVNKQVFGYQQAWYEHKYLANGVSGSMRPNDPMTLAYWNLAENFTSLPTLSSEFIKEGKELIDRALAYPSTDPTTGEYTGIDQFICEFYIQDKATRPMPLSSIPGLMDHAGKIYI